MTQSFQQLLVTNYGLLPSGYTGSQGIQGVPGTSDSTPKITAIAVTDSSYTVLDDTAVDVAGGYVQLTGTGFASGCVVMINNVPATSTTFVSSTQVQAQLPATAAGTYVVYLVNADGAVAIRINGITFSATPAWTTASALPGTSDGTAISIQLAAAGASTYALAAGSTLPGTVTLTSGGLLSGTVSGLANETTYSFTVVATDAELQDSPRTFSITITAGDPLFAATTLLLPGSADTFVRDASTNNFAVSIAGDTRPNTFNPYLTGWSNLFGVGDYLQLPTTSAFQFGTDNFTIECWVYLNSAVTAANRLIWYNFATTFGADSIFFGGHASYNGQITFWVYNISAAAPVLTDPTVLTANVWTHIAVVRNGSNFTMYRNGVSVSTATSTASVVGATYTTGGFIGTSGTTSLNGYLSNLRIANGTAVYTAAFTPPTGPLTAITNTSLLTCTDNRFRDDSTNNLTITPFGGVTVNSFSPFVEPATTNGSGYFDGTGDYLSLPTSAAILGSGNFTIELWVYPQLLANLAIIDTRGASTSTNGWLIHYGSDRVFRLVNDGNNVITTTTTARLNEWTHIAVCRVGSTVTFYVNGVASGTATNSSAFDPSSLFYIGIKSLSTSANVPFLGYMSNIRLVSGTALYTAAFTPPTQPLTAVANTSLLTLQNNQPANNSQFLDSSSSNFPITRAGNATQGTSSSYSPSGWSNYFDGTGDYLTVPSNSALTFSTGDFTIEGWYYLTAAISSIKYIFDCRNGGGVQAAPAILIQDSQYQYYVNGGYVGTGGTPIRDQWVHFALVKTLGFTKFYANGVQVFTYTDSVNYTSSTLRVGSEWSASGSYDWQGYISNFRVLKGTALYTTAFTPPTQPLTAVAGTSLLTCQRPQFVDNSPNRSAITRNGDVRVTNFAPFKAVVQTPVTYSAYFDGSGDYLTAPCPSMSGTWTIELWWYPTVGTSQQTLVSFNSGGGGGINIWMNGSNQQLVVDNGIVESGLFGGGTFTINAWNHVAIVRDGTTTRAYINGASVGSNTFIPADVNTISIGRYNGGSLYYVNGYISNLRVVIGTEVYTSNFTPPTQPLTAVANTSLLTCQSATFIDNSTNNFAITAVGNTQPTTVNPFGSASTNSTGYTASEYSGSMSFDGTGDYITVANTEAFAFGTGNFTVEAWVYHTSLPNDVAKFLIDFRSVIGSDFAIGFFGPKMYFQASTSLIGTLVVPANAWVHCAWVRNNGTLTLYLNGVNSGSIAESRSQAASPATIGAAFNGTQLINGSISDLRVVKGQAVYTSNFVPPLAPVEPVANTVLLLNGTGAGITDATTKTVLETVGDARISTAVSKFGGSSMSFDGSGDYILTTNSDNTISGTENFTIECWIYASSMTGWRYILSQGGASNNWLLALNGTTFYVSIYGGVNTTYASSMNINQWYHLAVTCSNGTTRLFLDGTLLGSSNASLPFAAGRTLRIGANPTNAEFWNGYMQDLRITKGHARYTANFTAPIAAFQTR